MHLSHLATYLTFSFDHTHNTPRIRASCRRTHKKNLIPTPRRRRSGNRTVATHYIIGPSHSCTCTHTHTCSEGYRGGKEGEEGQAFEGQAVEEGHCAYIYICSFLLGGVAVRIYVYI